MVVVEKRKRVRERESGRRMESILRSFGEGVIGD